jgi:ribosomal protein S18 acetylase RimI-like enzyme
MMQSSRTLEKTNEAVVIRRLTADDLDRLFDPAERVLGEQWLAQQERGELYVAVAEVNGAPVGRMCLNFTWYQHIGAGYCFAVVVRKELRSQGIGARINEHLESVARTRGLRALRCAAGKKNTRSIAWHERCGYKRIGESVVRWTDVDGREVEVDCWKFERCID